MCCLPPSWNPLPGGLGELLTPGREEWGQSSTEEALPGDAPTLHTPDARMPRGAQNGPALGADGRQQGRGGAAEGGAHLPVPVSHPTLLAFEGTIVRVLHVFCVTNLSQERGMGGGKTSEASQTPALQSAPTMAGPGHRTRPSAPGVSPLPFPSHPQPWFSCWEEARSWS